MYKEYDGRIMLKQRSYTDTIFHLRLFRDDHRAVAVATILQENPGNNIVNCCELAAEAVCQTFSIEPERLVWLQHTPPIPGYHVHKYDLFDRVTFVGDGNTFHNPRWERLPRELAEHLVGELLDPVYDRGELPAEMERRCA